jgi:hypothetical protein
MERSSIAISIGAACFGIVIGYITYRTLVRKGAAVITDIAGVIAAIGGGTVTVWFDQSGGDSFAYYSMGLLGGMILYYLQFRSTNDKRTVADLLTYQTGPEPALTTPDMTTRDIDQDELAAVEQATGHNP